MVLWYFILFCGYHYPLRIYVIYFPVCISITSLAVGKSFNCPMWSNSEVTYVFLKISSLVVSAQELLQAVLL